MIHDLRKSIIFLHGLSGSGKGEVHRKLAEQYLAGGYEAVYVSSGALFRAALSNPVIAEQVRKGYFLDTLGAIMLGVQTTFAHFVERWVESDGKAVIILDGLIRRGEFTTKEGVTVPSQLDQLARGFHEVLKALAGEEKEITDHFPEYRKENDDDELFSLVQKTLKDSSHIVVDITPEDTEAQMVRRADKETEEIKQQLNERVANGLLGEETGQKIGDELGKVSAILYGGITKENAQVVYLPKEDWPGMLQKNLYTEAAAEVRKIRETIARAIGVDRSTPLVDTLQKVGVNTHLRDDDISPVGRTTRISNYIHVSEVDGKRVVEPGFAARALCDGLSFRFTGEGFRSEERNCVVITNGKSRGVNLEAFRTKAEFLSRRLYGETEALRESIFSTQEGQRINRERE